MLNSQDALTSGVFCAQPWTIICHLLWATAKIPWKLDFGILMDSCHLERWQRKLREYSHFNASQLLLYFLVQWHHPHCKTEKPPLKKERNNFWQTRWHSKHATLTRWGKPKCGQANPTNLRGMIGKTKLPWVEMWTRIRRTMRRDWDENHGKFCGSPPKTLTKWDLLQGRTCT